MDLSLFSDTIISSIAAFTIGLIAIYSCHHLAKYTNLVDKPDLVRKFHHKITPTSGGIGISIAFITGVLLTYVLSKSSMTVQLATFMPYFSAAAVIMIATGVYDDLFGLSSRPKFIVQIVTALITCIGLEQAYLESLFINDWSAYAITVRILVYSIFIFWLVLGSNSINLVDGVDGLATILSLMIIFGLTVIGINWNFVDFSIFLYPLAGALLAFLLFNRPPASIFMGDTGSLLIGYVISTVTLVLALETPYWPYALSLPILFGMPLLDTLLSVIRRVKMGINPFESDSNHIHHIIQRHYKSPAIAVISLGLANLLLVMLSILLATTGSVPLFWLVFGLTVVGFATIVAVYNVKLNDDKSRLSGYFKGHPTHEPVHRKQFGELRRVENVGKHAASGDDDKRKAVSSVRNK